MLQLYLDKTVSRTIALLSSLYNVSHLFELKVNIKHMVNG